MRETKHRRRYGETHNEDKENSRIPLELKRKEIKKIEVL